MDETAHPGRDRRRLKDPMPILVNNAGHRVVKTKRGHYLRVEHYAVINARTLEEVLGRMPAPEIRRAIDIEQANPLRRRKLLIRLTYVLHNLQREEAIANIMNTVPAQLPRQGRYFTIARLERSALATFGPNTRTGKKRRANGSSYRSTLTKKIRERKAALEADAIVRTRASGRTHLTKRERLALTKAAGDHMHDTIAVGETCPLCGEVKQELASW
jgi:hypothetical protein